jgi:hypothetical protein
MGERDINYRLCIDYCLEYEFSIENRVKEN